jgi:two-component system, cell cycle response regulator DivK
MAMKSILVVDDNPENLKLILVLLAMSGHELTTAADAHQALECLAAHRPDLILLDLQLPGMDGLELTRRLKGKADTRDIPIVAVTAYAMKGDELKAREAGCDGYLVKPVDKHVLRALVKSYLGASAPVSDAI